MSDIITLAHGSGGKLTHKLISGIFHKHFKNDMLLDSLDSAIFQINDGKMAMSTDSYVITPIFFKGGNIGKLAVCGTVNDLAVCGARPLYLSCGMIIEEGLLISELEEIVVSMANAAKEAGVYIVTGDTKVVPKGCADKIFINTSGVGVIEDVILSPNNIKVGDKVILSGTMGDHGASILVEREKFEMESSLQSDCAPLNGLIQKLLTDVGKYVHVLRDPTRGGVATTLNEFTEGMNFGIRLLEDKFPIKDEVRGITDMLGLDPLYLANEGKILVIVTPDLCDKALESMRAHMYGIDAQVIGEVVEEYPGKVFIKTLVGGNRIVDMLVGDQLPRIC